MGQVISFGIKPVIRVERFGGLWGVSVRPCPADVPSLRSFDTSGDAAAYATALKAKRGWRIKPDEFDLSEPLDGAA